jgi:hypothetical protein
MGRSVSRRPLLWRSNVATANDLDKRVYTAISKLAQPAMAEIEARGGEGRTGTVYC